MAFNAKTDWKYNEVVMERDLNRIEKGIEDAHDAVASIDGKIGNLDGLNTTAKSNVVVAVNELFTNVSNGKNKIATALTDKGVPATGSETFDQLAAKISKAGIGDIDKKALIDIANRATDNDSTVRKAIITKLKAVSTENPLGLTDQSTWADISAAIPQIQSGKKAASGKIYSDSNGVVHVVGLTFKPNHIVFKWKLGSSNYRKLYHPPTSGNFKVIGGNIWPIDIAYETWDDPNSGTANAAMNWLEEEEAKVTTTSNSFKTKIGVKNIAVDWYAYE